MSKYLGIGNIRCTCIVGEFLNYQILLFQFLLEIGEFLNYHILLFQFLLEIVDILFCRKCVQLYAIK